MDVCDKIFTNKSQSHRKPVVLHSCKCCEPFTILLPQNFGKLTMQQIHDNNMLYKCHSTVKRKYANNSRLSPEKLSCIHVNIVRHSPEVLRLSICENQTRQHSCKCCETLSRMSLDCHRDVTQLSPDIYAKSGQNL